MSDDKKSLIKEIQELALKKARQGVDASQGALSSIAEKGVDVVKDVGSTVLSNPVNIARQVGKGGTFGLSTDIEAAVRAPLSRKSKKEIKEDLEASNREFLREHPVVATGARLMTPLGISPNLAKTALGRIGVDTRRLERNWRQSSLRPSKQNRERINKYLFAPLQTTGASYALSDAFLPRYVDPYEVTVPTAEDKARQDLAREAFHTLAATSTGNIQDHQQVDPTGRIIMPQHRRGAGRQLLQGIIPEYADEVEAAIRSLWPLSESQPSYSNFPEWEDTVDRDLGERYADTLKDIRAENKAYTDKHPWFSTGLNVAGGIGTGAALAATGAGIPGLASALPRLRFPLAGAASGAFAGAGASDPDPYVGRVSDRLTPSLYGAGFGAGLGTVIPKAVDVARYLTKPYIDGGLSKLTLNIGDKPEFVDNIAERVSKVMHDPEVARWVLRADKPYEQGLMGIAGGKDYVKPDEIDIPWKSIFHVRDPKKTAVLKIEDALKAGGYQSPTGKVEVDKALREMYNNEAVSGIDSTPADYSPHMRGLAREAIKSAPDTVRREVEEQFTDRAIKNREKLAKTLEERVQAFNTRNLSDIPLLGREQIEARNIFNNLLELKNQYGTEDVRGIEYARKMIEGDSPNKDIVESFSNSIDANPNIINIYKSGKDLFKSIDPIAPKIKTDWTGDMTPQEALEIAAYQAGVQQGFKDIVSLPNGLDIILSRKEALAKALPDDLAIHDIIKNVSNMRQLERSAQQILPEMGAQTVRNTGMGPVDEDSLQNLAKTAEATYFLNHLGFGSSIGLEAARSIAAKMKRLHPDVIDEIRRMTLTPVDTFRPDMRPIPMTPLARRDFEEDVGYTEVPIQSAPSEAAQSALEEPTPNFIRRWWDSDEPPLVSPRNVPVRTSIDEIEDIRRRIGNLHLRGGGNFALGSLSGRNVANSFDFVNPGPAETEERIGARSAERERQKLLDEIRKLREQRGQF